MLKIWRRLAVQDGSTHSLNTLPSLPAPTFEISLAVGVLFALVASGVLAADKFTWFLESAPAIIGLVLAVLTFRRFRLTRLLYVLLTVHAFILILGGLYTYAKVPLGFWLKDLLHLQRNPYDRIGHFAQGFVPAILAREILLRKRIVTRKGWLGFLCVCICLAFSAFYELIEWWTAVLSGDAANDFLGTQGDVWDTQWDMFTALCGAISAVVILAPWHNKLLQRHLSKTP